MIFFLFLRMWNSVRREVRDERDTENTNDDRKDNCNSRKHKKERQRKLNFQNKKKDCMLLRKEMIAPQRFIIPVPNA